MIRIIVQSTHLEKVCLGVWQTADQQRRLHLARTQLYTIELRLIKTDPISMYVYHYIKEYSCNNKVI